MPEWLLQLLALGAGGVAVYAGIRADLAALRVKADMALASAAQAHVRIDQINIVKG